MGAFKYILKTPLNELAEDYKLIKQGIKKGIRTVNAIDKKISEIDVQIEEKLCAVSESARNSFCALVKKALREPSYFKVSKTLEEELCSHKGELIIELKSRNRDEKTEAAQKIKSALSLPFCYALKTLPYVIIKTEPKYIPKMIRELQKPDRFGKAGYAMRSIVSISRSSARYLPEVLFEFARENKIKLPFETKKYFIKNAPKSIDGPQWNLDNIGAPEAWELSGTYGSGAFIAIIDTGVDYTHNDLVGLFGQNKGYDFVNNSDNPMDDHYHGTHCAGIAAGSLTGVAPAAGLYALKVLDKNGSGTVGDVVRALDWCIDNKPDIVSMSLGSAQSHGMEERACRAVYKAGIVICAAAGNEGWGPSYPAAYGEYVIAVAALDSNNNHADFSNIWMTNDISAPGVEIRSTIPGNGYAFLSGTSMATPHVSGAMALFLSKYAKEPSGLEDIMKKNATPLGDNETYGAGLLRIDQMFLNPLFKQKIYNRLHKNRS
ncbi:MAG: S8 family serine peptidase [Candidatus Woesearchaeota archaeon]